MRKISGLEKRIVAFADQVEKDKYDKNWMGQRISVPFVSYMQI